MVVPSKREAKVMFGVSTKGSMFKLLARMANAANERSIA